MAPKYRFGKNTVLTAAPVIAFAADGSATKPGAAAFKVLCLHQEVSVGLENGTMDIENFCTGGRTVSVRDGTQSGTMDLGNTTWVEDDDVLKMFEDAAFSKTETGGYVWIQVCPLGIGSGKPVYDLLIDVRTWKITSPAKGAITVEHDLSVLEGPTRGTQAA
ncbi:hypothetical protein [uncultured Deinococcus sp.]|uniref:hypothetical protein n=1 Tax=uncultured Deinococcus sp. TaxID=158789 RepID=UPI003748F737